MIRIIAGSQKGRRLKGPKDREFRPTTGRVKEFLFSYLGPDIEDCRMLDLFSGSGSLGLEALSRGARGVTFVEADRTQVGIVEQNISTCGFQSKASVIQGDVFKTVRNLFEAGKRFDFIMADPPFRASYHARIVETISRFPLLEANGELLIEHEKHDQAEPSGNMRCIRERRFGDCQISVYRRIVGNE